MSRAALKLKTRPLNDDESFSICRMNELSPVRRLRKEGVLKPGVHYRAMGAGSIRPPLVWDGSAIDLTLAQRSRRVLY